MGKLVSRAAGVFQTPQVKETDRVAPCGYLRAASYADSGHHYILHLVSSPPPALLRNMAEIDQPISAPLDSLALSLRNITGPSLCSCSLYRFTDKGEVSRYEQGLGLRGGTGRSASRWAGSGTFGRVSVVYSGFGRGVARS